MTFWIWFWGIALVMTLLFYTGLTVVVTVGGFKDVLAMFRNLDRQHREANETQVEHDE
ncbi:MAG: hypothetical protein QGH33_01735 [Pirellulaceae bacterium]|jgi:hypothetical protein|nr:hypothetical protein [Pirellulaceae bacterium]MDP7268246.1 hypothetical protein [Pirellulales bacterium]|tara:strand:+ start:226 stop:399 length:174 start_codon:yes stop_codon:yes gene_type:complete